MTDRERTNDLYEFIPGYPKPPSIPLLDTSEMDNPVFIGLRNHWISRLILSSAKKILGFNAFYRKLSEDPEPFLRQCDLRSPDLFAPVISATLIPDARILYLYLDIITAKSESDTYHGQVLEMGQYPNLFSTCQVVEGRSACIFKTIESSQITIIVNGRIYILNVWKDNKQPSVDQLRAAVETIISDSGRLSGVSPCIITTASNNTQFRAFKKLRKMKTNRDSLDLIKHSLFTLCLDLNDFPNDAAETARMIHGDNYHNLWFHSSLQIVVFGNAKAGIICNFSTYLDGNTMVRSARDIHPFCRDQPKGFNRQPGTATPCRSVNMGY